MTLGTSLRSCEVEIVGFEAKDGVTVEVVEEVFARLELNELMNSSALGSSPKSAFRCSAAASFEREEAYSRICISESLSRGKTFESCLRAHSDAIGKGMMEPTGWWKGKGTRQMNGVG